VIARALAWEPRRLPSGLHACKCLKDQRVCSATVGFRFSAAANPITLQRTSLHGSCHPPFPERWRSPVTQNPSHTALGSRCFSESHAYRKPLTQNPSFVPGSESQGKLGAHEARMERSRIPRGMWGCPCVASMPSLARASVMASATPAPYGRGQSTSAPGERGVRGLRRHAEWP